MKRVLNRIFDKLWRSSATLEALEQLIARKDVTEILIKSSGEVQVEEAGRQQKAELRFDSDRELRRTLNQLMNKFGSERERDGSVQASRLSFPNGKYGYVRRYREENQESAVIVVGKPRAVSFEDYLRWGVLSGPMVEFLKAVLPFDGRILVSGGPGSGRVPLLSLLGRCSNEHSWIVHAGDMPKALEREKYQFLPFPLLSGDRGRVQLANHLAQSRADVLIYDDCVGPEVWTLIRAAAEGLNLLTSVSASSPEDSLVRVQAMASTASQDIPESSVKVTLSRAFHFLIQIDRLGDGSRKITRISELVPSSGGDEEIVLRDIFVFEASGLDSLGRIQGAFRATGKVPQVVKLLEQRGIRLDRTLFSNERVSFPN